MATRIPLIQGGGVPALDFSPLGRLPGEVMQARRQNKLTAERLQDIAEARDIRQRQRSFMENMDPSAGIEQNVYAALGAGNVNAAQTLATLAANQARAVPKPTSLEKNYATAVKQGYPKSIFEYQKEIAQAGAPQPANAYEVEGAKVLAKRAGNLIDAGDKAREAKSKLVSLRSNLAQSPGGVANVIAAFGTDLGLDLGPGADAATAARAIIEGLVPAQREAGAGTSSNLDIAGFRKSLPKLIQTPGAQNLIIDTLESLQDWKIARGDIAQERLAGNITAAEEREAIKALGNPVEPYANSEFNPRRKKRSRAELPNSGLSNQRFDAASAAVNKTAGARPALQRELQNRVAGEGAIAEDKDGNRIILRNGQWEPFNG